ncbi:hypothetical protein [Flavivirga sp. 57AJ16]|uniref:hypothetical protein n=1 Tax=Flavivirga sp. 57AJ16 TaxID=3025307 RepID=UPI0023655AEE|nr:hypothetical protein [Flavivirga sp. 57AJ16]MDD7888028.1 hypothetical protein [Flavivirga sp. 57AJ16]
MPKKLIVVCLINFLIAALMGLALRFYFVHPMALNYRFLTHAHSHIAMLGWGYLMLYVLLIHYFVPDKKPMYSRLFWITEIAVIGMMLSFPFQGYAAVSITFSALHIFCSYYFVYLIWKHQKVELLAVEVLLKTALVLMVLSTLGVWCLGPAVGLFGQASAFYQIAIQFFLHFQFNGWFLIAVLAVFFHIIKIEDSKVFRYFFKLFVISTVLTFGLPVQWFVPNPVSMYINILGVLLQLGALSLFFKLIKHKLKAFLKEQSQLIAYLYYFSVFCLVLKILLQLTTLIPEFSEVVFTHRNFVIGFIHLLMLGVISGFLFAFILLKTAIKNDKILSWGVYTFLLGFVLTEGLLLLQGSRFYLGMGRVPRYYELLFTASIFLPSGILLILLYFFKDHKNHETTKTT